MKNTFAVRLFGDYGCFTRPELSAEGVSYDVPTPGALRNLLLRIYAQHDMDYVIERIHIMKSSGTLWLKKNGVNKKIPCKTMTEAAATGVYPHMCASENREQRGSLILTDLDFCVEARLEIKGGDNQGRHMEILNRRLENGQCWVQPCFGKTEYIANFEPATYGKIPAAIDQTKDFGFMFWGFDYSQTPYQPLFFHATMKKGVITVPTKEEVL